jgi:nucleoid-associated protein YgaU
MKRTVISTLVLALAFSVFAAKTEMTYEEYEQALAQAEQQEKTAKEGVAQEQAKIEALKQRLTELDQQIAQVIQEKYSILGITEQDVTNAENEIASIRQDLDLLNSLLPEELAKRTGDIKKDEARIAALKTRPVSYLWKIRDKIKDLEQLVEQLKAKIPTNSKANGYTVKDNPGKRDCLWRISEYDFIYGDAAQWPKIYTANKSLIDGSYNRYVKKAADPKYTRSEDLIFPGQELDIPR